METTPLPRVLFVSFSISYYNNLATLLRMILSSISRHNASALHGSDYFPVTSGSLHSLNEIVYRVYKAFKCGEAHGRCVFQVWKNHLLGPWIKMGLKLDGLYGLKALFT